MRNISIKWRMTLWFSLLMIAITALMLVFVMLMNRNTVTRPPEAELLYMVGRNADDVEFDHGDWDFSDVEQYAHGVYTEIFDEDGQRLFGTGAYFRVINPAASPAYARAVAILEDWDKSGQPVLEP